MIRHFARAAGCASALAWSSGCAGGTTRVPPPRPPTLDAATAMDDGDAGSDAGDSANRDGDAPAPLPARVEDRPEFAPDVLARCAFESGPGGDTFATLDGAWHADWLPADERQDWIYPEGSDAEDARVAISTRAALARAPGGHAYLVVVGLKVGGVEEFDCARVVWFDWDARQTLWRGALANTRGGSEPGMMYWMRTDGPYSGAGLLAWAGDDGMVRAVRFVDSPTVLEPRPVDAFAGGRSVLLYAVNDGMNFDSPTDVALIARGPDGLTELLRVYAGISTDEPCTALFGEDPDAPSPARRARPRCRVYPAGGIRVLAPGRAPRIEATSRWQADDGGDAQDAGAEDDVPWFERTERYDRQIYRFDPGGGRFVAQGRARPVRLRPHVEQLPR